MRQSQIDEGVWPRLDIRLARGKIWKNYHKGGSHRLKGLFESGEQVKKSSFGWSFQGQWKKRVGGWPVHQKNAEERKRRAWV